MSREPLATDYYSFYKIPKEKYAEHDSPSLIKVVSNFKQLVQRDLKKDIEIALLLEFLI